MTVDTPDLPAYTRPKHVLEDTPVMCRPIGFLITLALKGGLEQIQCRAGDSAVTIEGRHLWLLLEDLQTKLCEEVRESDLYQAQTLGVMHIETITMRLWL